MEGGRVWTTSVSVKLWVEDMRLVNTNALHIIKLTNISKEEWSREEPAPCLLLEGRSRAGAGGAVGAHDKCRQ